MITKTNFQTLESPNDGKTILMGEVGKLILKIQKGEEQGLHIPGNLIDEINAFVSRNSLTYSTNGGKKVDVCCYNCLIAHIIKKAEEIELSHEKVAFLGEVLAGGLGHNGYYMDKGKIIKI